MKGLPARAREDRVAFAIGLVLVAYAFFSTVDASVKWLVIIGYPALQLAFMRYAAHFVISTARIMGNGFSLHHFHTGHAGMVVLRGVMILGSTVLNFFALKHIPLTLTSTILFSSPIIVCLLAGTLLKEQVGPWRWIAVMIGFIGVVIAIRPFDESFHWAALLSVGAAVCFAIYLILTRRLAGSVASDTLQFYAGAVGFFVLLPFALLQWRHPDSALEAILLVGLGISAWIGHELLTRAYGYADAGVLTPYNYSFMLYLTAWSILLFDHYPDQWTLTGATIIIGSGLLIWIRETRRNSS